MEQTSFLPPVPPDEQKSKKRKWEAAFQNWSNDKGMNDETSHFGKCDQGSMCDYCFGDNSKGRPCVRALNRMCKEKYIVLDYDDMDFEKIWDM